MIATTIVADTPTCEVLELRLDMEAPLLSNDELMRIPEDVLKALPRHKYLYTGVLAVSGMVVFVASGWPLWLHIAGLLLCLPALRLAASYHVLLFRYGFTHYEAHACFRSISDSERADLKVWAMQNDWVQYVVGRWRDQERLHCPIRALHYSLVCEYRHRLAALTADATTSIRRL